MEFVLLHIPHIIPAFVAMGFLGRFAAVMADQPPAEFSDAQIEEWRRVRIERARSRRVRRTSARESRARPDSATLQVTSASARALVMTWSQIASAEGRSLRRATV